MDQPMSRKIRTVGHETQNGWVLTARLVLARLAQTPEQPSRKWQQSEFEERNPALLQASASSNASASLRSGVSNPSVNQP